MSSTQEAPARAQPETLRARSLMLSLTVNDIEKSLPWYRDVLGCHVASVYADGKAAALLAGEVRLLLNQDDWKRGKRVKGQGFRMTLQVTQDVDEVAERIKQAGGRLDSEPSDKPWGARSFDLTDPDGVLITISKPLGG